MAIHLLVRVWERGDSLDQERGTGMLSLQPAVSAMSSHSYAQTLSYSRKSGFLLNFNFPPLSIMLMK